MCILGFMDKYKIFDAISQYLAMMRFIYYAFFI